YRSRAYVTFGAPIPTADINVHSRTDVLELTRLVRLRIGALYKVLPTALFAAAMRPSITRRDLEARIDALVAELAARHANPGATSGRQGVEEAAEPLETRGIVVAERGRFRVRERTVLRYYARTIEHLLAPTGRTPCSSTARGSSSPTSPPEAEPPRSRPPAPACAGLRASAAASSPARRSRKRS